GLNNLTLFGLVLAIGIVVDDAIVVVEAVEHHIEHGLGPRDATIKAMQQVSGPVVAIGLVLGAVFVPAAFITGITGQFFRQFALPIAVSPLLPAFNSLPLSPALAALLLRPRVKGYFEPIPAVLFGLFGAWVGHKLGRHWAQPALDLLPVELPTAIIDPLKTWGPIALGAMAGLLLGLFEFVLGKLVGRPVNWVLTRFFRAFEHAFDFCVGAYTRTVSKVLRVSALGLVV